MDFHTGFSLAKLNHAFALSDEVKLIHLRCLFSHRLDVGETVLRGRLSDWLAVSQGCFAQRASTVSQAALGTAFSIASNN